MRKTTAKTEQHMTTAFVTSDLYQLLSLSLRLPNEEIAQALVDGSYQDDAINILQELSCSNDTIFQVKKLFQQLKEETDQSDYLLNQLRRDYTRLFNHPIQPVISIYESMFCEKSNEGKQDKVLFLNPVALHTESCYQEAGLHLISTSKEPADHMGTELEFMMYLFRNKGIALQEQDQESLKKIEQNINQFERFHLIKWVNKFFNRLEQESEILPYKAIAKLAKAGLKQVLIDSQSLEASH